MIDSLGKRHLPLGFVANGRSIEDSSPDDVEDLERSGVVSIGHLHDLISGHLEDDVVEHNAVAHNLRIKF